MAGLETISGGAANWPAQSANPLQQLAAAIVDSGGVGPSPLPAYQSSGVYQSMPGSREAYEQYGIPPVITQSQPWATATSRVFTDPYGQLGVQPLIGFPSAYPLVLNGVPNSPMRVLPFMNALMPTWFPQTGGAPQMPQQAAPTRRAAGGGNAAAKAAAAQPPAPAPQPQQVGYNYDETSWRNATMPTPAPPPPMYPMSQTPPELGGNVNQSPEAHAAGHGVDYPPQFKILPDGRMVPIDYEPPLPPAPPMPDINGPDSPMQRHLYPPDSPWVGGVNPYNVQPPAPVPSSALPELPIADPYQPLWTPRPTR